MNRDLDEQAYEQQMQWSLGEVAVGEVPPDVVNRVLAVVERREQAVAAPVGRSRWLATAALVVLGIAALFGVHHLSRKQGDPAHSTSPPVQDRKPYSVAKLADVAELPPEARLVWACSVSDDVVQAIAKRCPKLENLHVRMGSAAKLSEIGRVFTIAAALPTLRSLQVTAPPDCVEDRTIGEGIARLAALPLLESLEIALFGSIRLRPEAFAVLPKLASLRSLRLLVGDLDDAAVHAITRCPGLRQLRLPNCGGVTAARLASVVQIPTLEYLEIQDQKCSWELLADCKPKRLRVLNASNTNFRNEHLGWLPPVLTELDLSNTSGDSSTCCSLSKLVPKLQKLSLSGCTIGDAGFEALATFEDLRELDITNVPLARESLRRLPNMERLCSLKMSALNWLSVDDLVPFFEAGIDVEVTRRGTGMEHHVDMLRDEHAGKIKARRDRVMKR